VQRHLPRREEIAMLDSCQNAQERWGGVHKLIDRWLEERQELVQAFRALRDASRPLPTRTRTGISAVLVDYVSAWHFEVSEQLVSEAKAFGDTRGLELATQINPASMKVPRLPWLSMTIATRGMHRPRAFRREARQVGQPVARALRT
jgi:hypothetical protein